MTRRGFTSRTTQVAAAAVACFALGCARDGRGRSAAGTQLPSNASSSPLDDSKAGETASDPRLVPGKREVATLAGGCFWGMEELIRGIPGVIDTNVGYTGGTLPDATYGDVKTGRTGHAEAVQIVFDPSRVSYETILLEFFRMHDPTTRNRQGNDVGTQYRSAIFYHSDEQRRVAEAVKLRVDRSGAWDAPVVTEIVPATPFYEAEAFHQDYLKRNPGGYTCHYVRPLTF